MSGYIGTVPVPQATQTREAFTASANQTSFATIGYEPGFLDVFLNGVKLAAADYTATNAINVVLATGAAVNDILEIVAYKTFNVANTLAPNGSAANLTNLPSAQLTGALPAISGANLTGLVATFSGLSDTTVSTSDPALNTNPSSGVGHIWANRTSGEMYILKDATANGNVWLNVGDGTGGVGPFVATGGTKTTSGSYTIHTFTSSGTFAVSTGDRVLQYIVVAGGGGGGFDDGAGGGAGGYLSSVVGEQSGGPSIPINTINMTVGNISVVVGAGGAGGGSSNANGNNSSITLAAAVTAIGGGKGAGNGYPALGGGSAGGNYQGVNVPLNGTAGQGNKGIKGASAGRGGHGGGAGQDAQTYMGGIGIASSINGTSTYRASGGGGGLRFSAGVNVQAGGGGNGGLFTVQSVAGTANSGGGGGGGCGQPSGGTNQNGAAGGSGTVIIRYLT